MTCKDCVHFEVCANVYCEVTAETEIKNIHNKPCFYFKDKSKYIELPCKVGDTVYWICHKGGKPYISEEIVQSIHCDVRKTLEFTLLNPNNKILKSNVFLTKSEAEQKLKELQNGDKS